MSLTALIFLGIWPLAILFVGYIVSILIQNGKETS
jgi:TM2 domain-containing membrane protein YozV